MGTEGDKSGVSDESKDAVHKALFGDGDDDGENGSQGGSGDDDHDDDSGDGDQGGDGDDGDKEDVTKLPQWAQDKLKKVEADNFKYRDAARKARTGGGQKDGKAGDDKGGSGDKGDESKNDVAQQIEDAKTQARLDAKAEYSEQLVATRLEAALDAMNVQGASDIVSDLNLGKFVTDEGEIDKDALKAKIEQFKTTYRRRRGVGHGNSGGDKNSGVTNADRFAEAIGL